MRPLAHALAVLALASTAACSDPAGNDDPPIVQPQPVDTSGFLFEYTPPAGAPNIASLAVAGAFNSWSTTTNLMSRRVNGTWFARIRLADGQYEYKFHINGAWPSDMCFDRTWGNAANNFVIHGAAITCVADGFGGQNALINVGAADTSLAFQHAPSTPAQLSQVGDRLSVRFRANVGTARSAIVRVGTTDVPMHQQLINRTQAIWRATIPATTSSYSIVVERASGSQTFGPYTVPGAIFRSVSWVGNGVGYQIFPDRFANGDPSNDSLALTTDEYQMLPPALQGTVPRLTPQWNGPVTDSHCCHQYFGGDLAGVISKLDHLQSLGVTMIYFNPIFLSGSAHGYDTWDYSKIDPAYGDTTTLRSLLQAANARGMRVMWDFVPNHTGVGNPQFRDAVARGTTSPFWDWFTFKVPAAQVQIGNAAHYDAWFGFGSLPKLNTTRPTARALLIDAVRQWTQFGLQGIRVDVPNEITNRVEFFNDFRQTAKAINPDVYLVGEIWQRDASWLQGDQFDALMNYAIGQDVIEKFALGQLTGGSALQSMAQLFAEYPEASSAMLFNVISTHDNSRLLTKMGGGGLGTVPSPDALARQRLATAMNYALPGIPLTWQGDECAQLGASGGRDEHRYPVQWDRCDAAMLTHYRLLGRLRRDTPALQSSAIRLVQGGGSTISWLRGEPGTGEVLVTFNAGTSSAAVTLPAGTWTDLVSGESVTGTADVGARGFRYLRRT